MSARIEWVGDDRRLAELADAWEPLQAHAGHPFLDHAWMTAWWGAFGAGSLQVAAAWRGDELAGVLPLARRAGALSSLANYHSPIYEPLAADAVVRDALLDAAAARRDGELHVHALPADGDAVAAVTGSMRRAGRRVAGEAAHDSPYVDCLGDLAAYAKGLGSTLRRRRRKLEREHEVALHLDDGGDDLDEALRVGFALEGSGWKLETGTAIVSAPETERFYRNLARAYRERGELVLGRLDIDGAPAAWQFCLRRGDVLFMLKTGYDVERRALAPGLVMHLLTIERCFEGDTARYDLLGDSERWKLEFATGSRRHARLWGWRPTPAGLARGIARRRGVPLARAAREHAPRLLAEVRRRASGAD